MQSTFFHAKIAGITTVVPSQIIDIDSELYTIYQGDQNALNRIKKVIGLQTRHIADTKTTASDLGEYAAKQLFKQLKISPKEIDALIMVTQTPDYFIPATACYLHGKLNLPTTALAFDINQACAGYLYGLYTAYSLIDGGKLKNILLICGDTLSKLVNPLDSNIAPIIGDGVSATLIQHSSKETQSFFELGAKGDKFFQLIVPEGAMRVPSCDIIPDQRILESSHTRNLKQLYMDGAEIFNFAVMEEPKSFKSILEYAQCNQDDLDYVFFHQANKYIVDNITKRLTLDPNKVPNNTTGKYGNLSGCSIPATICDTLTNPLSNPIKIAMAGFGAGLSWGNAIMELDLDFQCQEVLIYKQGE